MTAKKTDADPAPEIKVETNIEVEDFTERVADEAAPKVRVKKGDLGNGITVEHYF